jgi:CheY-like chemotaxis protein
MDEQALNGIRVLVVEDDYLLATVLGDMLEHIGAKVVGSFGWLDEALAFVSDNSGDFDLVMLDIDLHGAKSYPIADKLAALGRKFLFVTGYSADAIAPAYRAHPRCEKPCNTKKLKAALLELSAS